MNLGGRNYIGIITRGRLCSVDVGAPVKLTMRLGGWTEPPGVAEASGRSEERRVGKECPV